MLSILQICLVRMKNQLKSFKLRISLGDFLKREVKIHIQRIWPSWRKDIEKARYLLVPETKTGTWNDPIFPQLDKLIFSIKKYIIIIYVSRDTTECFSDCWTSYIHDLCPSLSTDTSSKLHGFFLSLCTLYLNTLFFSALYLTLPIRLRNLNPQN